MKLKRHAVALDAYNARGPMLSHCTVALYSRRALPAPWPANERNFDSTVANIAQRSDQDRVWLRNEFGELNQRRARSNGSCSTAGSIDAIGLRWQSDFDRYRSVK